MTTMVRPGADEIPQSYADYVGRIGDDEDIMTVLETQVDEVKSRLARFGESRGGYRYAPGKWSVKEIVGHCSDVERIFVYRALRFARGDATPLPGFDENAYTPEMDADARSLADLTGEWMDVRRATIAFLRGMPAPAWQRRGVSNGKEISVRALILAVPGHVRHHLAVLDERYR